MVTSLQPALLGELTILEYYVTTSRMKKQKTSLGELETKQAEMSDRGIQKWWISEVDGTIQSGTDDEHYEIGKVNAVSDAVGIVATHNSTGSLIQIARAALAWQKAKRRRARFGTEVYENDPFSITTPEFKGEAMLLDIAVENAEQSLAFALYSVEE